MWTTDQIYRWVWEQHQNREPQVLEYVQDVCAEQIKREQAEHWTFMLGMMYPWQRWFAGQVPLFIEDMKRGNWDTVGAKVSSLLDTNTRLLEGEVPRNQPQGWVPFPPHALSSLAPEMPWDVTGTVMMPGDPLAIRALQTAFAQHYGKIFGEWAVKQAVLVYIYAGATWSREGASQSDLIDLTTGRLRDTLAAHASDVLKAQTRAQEVEAKLRTAKGKHILNLNQELQRLESVRLIPWESIGATADILLVDERDRVIREAIGAKERPASLSQMLFGKAEPLDDGSFIIRPEEGQAGAVAKQLGVDMSEAKAADPILVSLSLAMLAWRMNKPADAIDAIIRIFEQLTDQLNADEIARLQRIIG